MNKYRCKKAFYVDCYDGDGFIVEGDFKYIKIGDTYEVDESGSSITGAEIHLDGESDWLEISKEILEECFEEVQSE